MRHDIGRVAGGKTEKQEEMFGLRLAEHVTLIWLSQG